jgi:hypothetical protein
LKKILSVSMVFVCVLLLGASANAKPFSHTMTFEITGIRGESASRLQNLGLAQGDVISGGFTLENSLVDNVPLNLSFAQYSYLSTTPVLYFDLGPIRLNWLDLSLVVLDNYTSSTPRDGFSIRVFSSGGQPLDIAFAEFNFFFFTTKNLGVFGSDAVPARIYGNLFENKQANDGLDLVFADGTAAELLLRPVDVAPVNLQPVPEPSSFFLMASGVLGAGYLLARRKR